MSKARSRKTKSRFSVALPEEKTGTAFPTFCEKCGKANYYCAATKRVWCKGCGNEWKAKKRTIDDYFSGKEFRPGRKRSLRHEYMKGWNKKKRNDLPNYLRQSKAARVAWKNDNFARAYGRPGMPDFSYSDIEAKLLSMIDSHKKGVRVRRCRDGRVQLWIGILSWHLSEKEALKIRKQLNRMELCGRK